MNRKEYIEEIKNYFVKLVTEIKINTACCHYDINSIVENFYIPILKHIYGCKDLENKNIIKDNFPSIDLGSNINRTSFQVTSSPDTKKIIKTIEKFKKYNLKKQYDRLYILIITEKQKKYSSKKLKRLSIEIEFDIKNNIIDYKDLIKIIINKDIDFLKELTELLKKEFEKNYKFSLCRDELNEFLELSASRINLEKESKKYIPDVFVESNKAKEKGRFFSNPLFFYRKILDTLEKINYEGINEYLLMMNLDKIESSLTTIISEFKLSNLTKLQLFLGKLKNVIEIEKNKIMPYSEYYDGKKYEDFYVPKDKMAYRSILVVKLRSISWGILHKYDEALLQINLCLSRVLLITSMAGQGKTNFVCDFVEHFCTKFEVPIFFIPARELNSIPDHSIFSYITNNRYLKDLNNKFELLKFFDEFANKIDKPFIIIIDGMNEVRNLELFNNVLSDFIETTVQYNFVKLILTCRIEFFEKKYASLLSKPFSKHIYHLKNIKAEMSDFHLTQGVKNYFKFYNIKARLTKKAEKFLKDDLLLLKIFCELNKNTNLGLVEDIFKDQLYEGYLISVIEKFDHHLKKDAIPTLYKLIEKMLSLDVYSSLQINGFNKEEEKIIEQFVLEDVILRRELPVKDLVSIGTETVNFTYDELRDFLIAHYFVNSLSKIDLPGFIKKYDEISKLPIYEGSSKFTYILSRKYNNADILSHIESKEDFEDIYSIVLFSLPPEYQKESDKIKVNKILSKDILDYSTKLVAIYLHSRESEDEILNISILIEHINSLKDNDFKNFIEHIFQVQFSVSDEHRKNLHNYIIGTLEYLKNNIDDYNDNSFIFLLQISSIAVEIHHKILMQFIRIKESKKKLECFRYVKKSTSSIIRDFVSKIKTRSESVQSL